MPKPVRPEKVLLELGSPDDTTPPGAGADRGAAEPVLEEEPAVGILLGVRDDGASEVREDELDPEEEDDPEEPLPEDEDPLDPPPDEDPEPGPAVPPEVVAGRGIA